MFLDKLPYYSAMTRLFQQIIIPKRLIHKVSEVAQGVQKRWTFRCEDSPGGSQKKKPKSHHFCQDNGFYQRGKALLS